MAFQELCNKAVVIEDICWQTVNRIVCKYGTKQLNKRNAYSTVTRIGIDEIALKKGHKNYVAVVVDLDTGTVLDLLEDRTKEFLVNYFKSKGPDLCQQIKLFCSDLWEGYINCAKSVFPQAIIVTDRFHFFAKLQTVVDRCRRYYRKKYPKDTDLVNLKWVMLKNESDLSKAEKVLLSRIFSKSEYALLQYTYESKNKFRCILEADISRLEAEAKMQVWLTEIKSRPNHFILLLIPSIREV